MSRSRGRRYSEPEKLNVKKVFAVCITLLVIIMFAVGIRKILTQEKSDKISKESYYTIFQNDKYGVIDSSGKIIIEPSYAELIIIPNKNKDAFICTYDINYNANEYKTKVLNSKNQEVFTEYDGVEALENYDKNNNIKYNTTTLKVKKDNKYGLISIDGKELLSCVYDKINVIIGNENSIIVEKDGKVGLVDNNGKKVIDTKYNKICKLSDDYKNGYIVSDEAEKYGTVDCANNIILNINYSEIKPIYSNGMYVTKGTTGYDVIDKTGSLVTKKEYEDVKDIKNDQIIVKENNKYGVIKTTGEQILDCNYDDIDFAGIDKYIVKNDNMYGVINSNKELIIENKYQLINYFEGADIIEISEDGITSNILNNKLEVKLQGIISEVNVEKGYIKIKENDDYKYYNFKFDEKSNKEIYSYNTIFTEKKYGKYGYVDKEGKIVVDYIYDDATEINSNGYAAVNLNGKWGSIDSKGDVVATIDEELSLYPVIDFIGEWHLMKDTNLNCYTK